MTWTGVIIAIFYFFQGAVIFYMAAINVLYFFLTLTGFFVLRRRRRLGRRQRDAVMKSSLAPGISLIAPAYNESLTVRESVRGLLSLNYPQIEVIVVNDGSTDDTLAILTEEFRLYKSARMPGCTLKCKRVRGVYESRDPMPIVVVDKENGRKADAVNAGIQYARMPLVAVLDCDSLLEPDSLIDLARPFMEDERVVAAGGVIRILNGCRVRHGRVESAHPPSNWFALIQVVEYLRAFLGGRVAWNRFNALLIISGAFGLFRRDILVEAGGYEPASIGEDMEMVVRLHRRMAERGGPYRIVFVPEPVCWTEVPEDRKSLVNQRGRWQRGTVEVLSRHRKMILNPRYGAVGLTALPYFLLFEMLGPVVELCGYVLVGIGLWWNLTTRDTVVLYFIVSILFGILLSMFAVLLEEFTVRRYSSWRHTARLFLGAVVENIGYRQFLTVVRIRGMIDYWRGKGGWGPMVRRGINP